jgi:hypothetical protein
MMRHLQKLDPSSLWTHQRLQLRSWLADMMWASSSSTAKSEMGALRDLRLQDICLVLMSQARTSPPEPPLRRKPERFDILRAVTPVECERA